MIASLLDLSHKNTEEDMPTDSECVECHGTGRDEGDRSVGYGESDCTECHGTGRMERNWLEEALLIASHDYHSQVHREHVVALAVHAIELLRSANMIQKPVASEVAPIRKGAVKEAA